MPCRASVACEDPHAAARVIPVPFRFDVGEPVVVVTHPARPAGTVTARWPGDDGTAGGGDTYGEPTYAVSGFVTRQRQSSLAPAGFAPLSLDPPTGWRLAGHGGFERIAPGTIESRGGPGVLWYARETFGDVVVTVDWRTRVREDRSGILLRVPALAAADPDQDWRPAIEQGVEIGIHERGGDDERRADGRGPDATGAVCARAAAMANASRGPDRWNTVEIAARGSTIEVRVNRVPVAAWGAAGRPPVGHLALRCHDARSRVAFRNLQVRRL